jgi:antitoxin YefM
MTTESPVQYVSDDSGNAVAVIVPIELWREIESERETSHLLKSETMRKRLLEAKQRTGGISLDEVRKNLEFAPPTARSYLPLSFSAGLSSGERLH